MKIRLVGTELLHADRRTDMTKLIVVFRNFAKGRKKRSTQKLSTLREKQESGTVYHTTNALTGRISPTYPGYF